MPLAPGQGEGRRAEAGAQAVDAGGALPLAEDGGGHGARGLGADGVYRREEAHRPFRLTCRRGQGGQALQGRGGRGRGAEGLGDGQALQVAGPRCRRVAQPLRHPAQGGQPGGQVVALAQVAEAVDALAQEAAGAREVGLQPRGVAQSQQGGGGAPGVSRCAERDQGRAEVPRRLGPVF